MSRSSRVLLLVLPLLVALTGVSTAAPPAEVKGYTATATWDGGAITLRLTNSTASTSSFGSAEVRLPLGLTPAAEATVSRAGWSVTPRTVDGRSVLRLVSGGKGTTDAVAPGKLVDVRIPLAPDASGVVALTTQVKQSNDFSGTGNDFTRTGPEPSVTVTAPPPPGPVPAALVFGQQPSDVQASTAGAGTPGTLPITVMCPAPTVRVVDASGATVTSLPPTQVTLRPVGADPGLLLDSSPSPARSTASGVATFGSAPSADGTCTSGLSATVRGLDYQLRATAKLADGRELSTGASTPFDVLSFYALCAAECTTPVLSSSGTTAQATATGGTGAPDRLVFTVDQDQWTAPFTAACGNDVNAAGVMNPYRKVVTIDVADHAKTVQLRWNKQAVQWATNNGTPKWSVCIATAYPFTAAGGPATQVVADGTWWVGELLACGAAPAGSPCLSSLTRSAGDQLATVFLPDVDGDPRMI